MAVIYCYLEREIYKLLKFHTNNFFYFEISAPPSFKRNLPISTISESFKTK